MKIYTPKDLPLTCETVITIGSFDGIHLGHKALFRETKELAVKLNAKPLIVSFDPHPRQVLFPQANFKLLTTLEEKLLILSKLNIIKEILLIPFTPAIAKIPPDLFVQEYIVSSLKAKGVVVGFNFRFGKNKKGDIGLLKTLGERYNFLVKTLSEIKVGETTVSSTQIRHLIEKGEVEKANELMGHPYFIKGKVIKGKGRGVKLGFPTANLEVPSFKLIPSPGVYAVWVYWKDQRFKGAMNIGTKPTFKDKELSMEVHIFNFNKNIYQQELKIEVIKHIREEKKFPNLEALKKQIKMDCELIDKILNQNLPSFLSSSTNIS